MEKSDWYENTKLGKWCDSDNHCKDCRENGDCDTCDTFDGRWIEAVSDYASSCDYCGELTSHEQLHMDPVTQLGYCDECVPKLSEYIRARLTD